MNSFKLSHETETCHNRLVEELSTLSPMFIAFSGGTDSTLLVEAASRIKNITVTAITVNSPLIPRAEIEKAAGYMRGKNIKHIMLTLDPLKEKRISENSPMRCYHCKKFLFENIIEAAAGEGVEHILDGTHYDDTGEHRPGLMALSELGIKSPLKTSGFKKNNIRELAWSFNLSNWDSPPYPCLATRIPHWTPILESELASIEKAESCISSLGFSHVRVRVHGDVARIEIPHARIGEFASEKVRADISRQLKSLGFKFVTLDLDGYRTGSMDITGSGETDG